MKIKITTFIYCLFLLTGGAFAQELVVTFDATHNTGVGPMIGTVTLFSSPYGDNYSDHPKKLGGGGARMACGVVD